MTCAPGLDALLGAELRDLGLRPKAGRPGELLVQASSRQLYQINLASRLATRVFVRTRPFPAHNVDELVAGAAGLPWDQWIQPGSEIRLRAMSSSSRLFHTKLVESTIGGFLSKRLGVVAARPLSATAEETPRSPIGEQPQLIAVRLVRNQVTISIDSSGDELHRRGWRRAVAKAPVRETLAAAMLASSGWDGTTPLVDPFCGSGTIVIEAARLARSIAPGSDRFFAFHQWPEFEPGTWASVRAERVQTGDDHTVQIVGRDRDAGAIAAARSNAERAGVADCVDLDVGPVSALDLGAFDRPGSVITNPPWGARLDAGGDLRNLAARFGSTVGEAGEWNVGLLVGPTAFADHTGLDLETRFRTSAGGTRVRFMATAKRPDRRAP